MDLWKVFILPQQNTRPHKPEDLELKQGNMILGKRYESFIKVHHREQFKSKFKNIITTFCKRLATISFG